MFLNPRRTRAGVSRPGGAGASFASDPELRQAVRQVVTALRRLPGAASDVRSPLVPGGRSLLSADGRSALVTFTVRGNATQSVTAAQRIVAAIPGRHLA